MHDPFENPIERDARRLQAQSLVKTPERRVESDARLRTLCVEFAVRASLQGTSATEIVALAREFEQFIIGRPDHLPMKEATHG